VSFRNFLASVAALGATLFVSMAPRAAADARPAAQAKSHTITMEAVQFQPDVLTIKTGDSVVWVNKDPFPHTATSKNGLFDSKQIQPQKSFKLKLVKKGEYEYVCALHPTMKARLKVE
jgi:plastocyanin